MSNLAKTIRLSALQMALNCGKNGSHLGAGLSAVEIMAALYGGVLQYDINNKDMRNLEWFYHMNNLIDYEFSREELCNIPKTFFTIINDNWSTDINVYKSN